MRGELGKKSNVLSALMAAYGMEIRTAKKKVKAKQDDVTKERSLAAAEAKRQRKRLKRLKEMRRE